MPGMPVEIGPWKGGLANSSGVGEFINDDQAFRLINLEVDVDGSLVNRPSIRKAAITGFSPYDRTGYEIIGTHTTLAGEFFLVLATVSAVHLVNPSTSSLVFTHTMNQPKACITYHGELFVIPQAAGQGGRVTNPTPTTFAWAGISTMPIGMSAVVYLDRMFIAQGAEARLVYSDITNFSSWPVLNSVGIGWHNSEPIRDIKAIGQDIIVFKADSTWRYGYAADPAKAEVRILSETIGAIDERSTAVGKNNVIYVLHYNGIYELSQNQYTLISEDLDMIKRLDPTLYYNYGVSAFQNRVMVRYHTKMYVLSLKTQRWSEWESGRAFAKAFVLPSNEPGEEIAYMAHASELETTPSVYFMTDSRIDGVNAGAATSDNTWERFTCYLTTKTYDFMTPSYFKTILMGVLAIATSSATTVKAVVPGSAAIDAPTWGGWYNNGESWGGLYDAGVTWGTPASTDGDIITQRTVPPDAATFGRKALKVLSKFRYRQVQFIIEVPAYTNNVAAFSVRIYNLTVYAMQKQTIVAAVTA